MVQREKFASALGANISPAYAVHESGHVCE